MDLNMEMINTAVEVPKYVSVKTSLIKKIEGGSIKRGEKLPSERDLSDLYNVSRMTARSALNELVKDGYAYRHGNAGTFASRRKTTKDVLHAESFSSYARSIGVKELHAVVLEQTEIQCSVTVSEAMELPQGSSCYQLKRVRYGDGIPMAVENAYLRKDSIPEFLSQDFSSASLWEMLASREESRPNHVYGRVELEQFTPDLCNYLKIKDGYIGFKVPAQVRNSFGEVIEFVTTYYLGDYSFAYEMDISGI